MCPIDSDLDTKELSKQVVDLFLLSSEEHAKRDQKTVLLLLDIQEKVNDLPVKNVLREDLIEEIHKRKISTKAAAVILLNCIPTDFTLKDTLILPSKLSEEDIKHFKEKLLQQIRVQRKGHWKITTVNLFYHEDSSGSALASEVLRDLTEEFTCETLTEPFKTDNPENKEEFERKIESKARELHKKYKDKEKPVLLLLDHEDDKPLRSLIKNLQSKLQRDNRTDHPAFIVINAVSKSAVRVPSDVRLKMELLPEEKQRFAQKTHIKKRYKKQWQKFHAFNIMQGGFQKNYAETLITKEMVQYVKNHTKSSSTRLLSFLALINSYVPGSHLSKHLCKEFIKQERWSDEEEPSLEKIIMLFDHLMVIFSEGDKVNCIRLAHPMIADACLKMLTEHKLTRYDISRDFLEKMVKGKERNYEKICKSMLVTRPKGLIKKEKFSRLILDMLDESENNINLCVRLLKSASRLFSTDPFYPQALARLYYIEVKGENKYKEAEKWANKAIEIDGKNSHIRDTLGQVHKIQLSRIWKQKRKEWWKVEEPCTDIDKRLAIAQSAIKAFDDEEKAAKEELTNPKAKYNNRGLFGFLQVCKEIDDLRSLMSPENPLKQKYLDFIKDLRGGVEEKYDFFEWYLAFSKPSFKEEEPDYFHRDVEDCYMRYFTQETQNEEKTLNEKKKKSFEGLLHFLKSDNVCKQNLKAIKKPQSEDEDQIVLYIFANIILSLFGLRAMLQKLWFSKERGRSPEFYLLIFLLFWPDEAQKAKANPPNLENCVQYMSQSYDSKYERHLRGRYLVPLFFLGKERGLQKVFHALKPHKNGLQRVVDLKLHQTDLELLTQGDESVEVEYLQHMSGKVENHEVFAVIDAQQIQVTPHDRARPGVFLPGLQYQRTCSLQHQI